MFHKQQDVAMVRFVVSVEQLHDVLLDVVAPVVPPRSAWGGFENIRLAFRRGELEVLGGDGEQFVQAVVPVDCDVEKEVVALVPGKLFTKLWRMLSGEVVLSCDGSSLVLENAAGRYELRTLPPQEYAEPLPFPEGQVELDGKALAAALGRGVRFVGESEYGGPLRGVLLEIDEEGVTVVAADGYRMAIERIGCSGIPQGTKQRLVVQRDIAKTIVRLAPSSVVLGWNDKYVSFVADGIRVWGWLEAGEYPSWQRVMEGVVRRYRAIVDPGVLQDALCRVAPFAGRTERVVLEFSDGTLRLTAEGWGTFGQETVPCEFDGAESVRVALRVEYLDDVLWVLRDEERVVVWMGDPKQPVVWEPGGTGKIDELSSSRMYIVAPMQ